jgi:hypothetical protein
LIRALHGFGSLMIGLVAAAVDAQEAPAGFAWKKFDDFKVSVQVPDGWHTRVLDGGAGKARAIQITKEKVDAQGFDTGLTVNFSEFRTDEEMNAAILEVGNYMAKLHDTFDNLVESSVGEKGGVPTMILEGTRTLPDKNAGGLYHTRTIVRMFKADRRIYTIIFGSPADRWEADYKLGEVMLNPILFQVMAAAAQQTSSSR